MSGDSDDVVCETCGLAFQCECEDCDCDACRDTSGDVCVSAPTAHLDLENHI